MVWTVGEAPVKAEYRVELSAVSRLKETAAENHKPATNQEGGDDGEPKAKKARGQNKPSQRSKNSEHTIIQKKAKLCSSFNDKNSMHYRPCEGEGCKAICSLDDYLPTKEAELTSFEKCPLVETFGYCKFGYECLLLSKHYDPESKKLDYSSYESSKSDPVDYTSHYKNWVTMPDLKNLRRRKYIFTLNKSKQFVKTFNNTRTQIQKLEELLDENSPLLDYMGEADKESKRKELETLKVSGPAFPEKKKIDFRRKTYLAPLTTVGNLPFRRLCKGYSCDITVGEMALCSSLLKGSAHEWALLRKHKDEDLYGVQICAGDADVMSNCCEAIKKEFGDDVDFIDLNMGCPIDGIVRKCAGSGMLRNTYSKQRNVILPGVYASGPIPFTCKIRTGYHEKEKTAHKQILKTFHQMHIPYVTLHGRSREGRYTKDADWEYIRLCAQTLQEHGSSTMMIGNGDILSVQDWNEHMKIVEEFPDNYATCMIGRGALIKPWLFQEIKEQKTLDPSSQERFEMLRKFCRFGLEHYGSDEEGVAKTRRFLLEWLSFTCRYIPVGILERLPQKINERPPMYFGRNDLETLLSSPNADDWVKISEMILGPVQKGFEFKPKHKSNSYQVSAQDVIDQQNAAKDRS